MQEEELEDLLQRAFPKDIVKRVGKGRSGADVIQTVVVDGEAAGSIIYESKNVKGWQNHFVSKLAKERVKLGARYAVLVSTAFPAGEDAFCIRDGIPIVHPRHVVTIVNIVRDAIAELKQAEDSLGDSGYKYEQLIGYLNSPDFTTRIGQVLKTAAEVIDLQEKERSAHDRTWVKQRDAIATIHGSTSEVASDVRGILRGA